MPEADRPKHSWAQLLSAAGVGAAIVIATTAVWNSYRETSNDPARADLRIVSNYGPFAFPDFGPFALSGEIVDRQDAPVSGDGVLAIPVPVQKERELRSFIELSIKNLGDMEIGLQNGPGSGE